MSTANVSVYEPQMNLDQREWLSGFLFIRVHTQPSDKGDSQSTRPLLRVVGDAASGRGLLAAGSAAPIVKGRVLGAGF